MFDLKVISPKRVVYEDAVYSVRVDGDDSEYEFLSFHARCIGVLRQGYIIVNNKLAIPVKKGIAKFSDNKCTILIEEAV